MSLFSSTNFMVVHVWISIFAYSFMVTAAFLEGSQNEACQPTNCGTGPNISYPFYIQNSGGDSCGYPGFEVQCQGNKPIYKTSKNSYIIQDISYENRTFYLVSAEVINSTCFTPLQTYSLNLSTLEFSTYHADLYFFYGCTSPFSVDYRKSPIRCASSDTNRSFVVLVPGDGSLDSASVPCQLVVAGPVQPVAEELNKTINDLDYIKLWKEGFSMKWNVSGGNGGGQCGFLNGNSTCSCAHGSDNQYCHEGTSRSLTTKLVIAALAAGIAILIILAFCFRKHLACFNLVFWKNKSKYYQNIEAFLRNYGSPSPRRYTYVDIKRMTNSFRDKLGQGGYGSGYKGKLPDGCDVAVKILHESISGNGEDFINEVASISRTSHNNIVTLLGFCFEGSNRALIYELVSNGSLERFIYNENAMDMNRELKWKTLQQIAIGVAQGLEYLHQHCNPRILHLDIKPCNILLDEDFCPKISDFGLAKICHGKESIVPMSAARGTIGYIAPEVFLRHLGGVSHKSDVYSYGMMILEMTVGRKNVNVSNADHSSEVYFPDWIYKHLELQKEVGLQGIRNEEDEASARKMVIVGLWCIQTDPSDRPPMSKVVEMLEGTLDCLQIPPKPSLSSPVVLQVDSSTTSTTTTL